MDGSWQNGEAVSTDFRGVSRLCARNEAQLRQKLGAVGWNFPYGRQEAFARLEPPPGVTAS
jgi:hypothetical protein